MRTIVGRKRSRVDTRIAVRRRGKHMVYRVDLSAVAHRQRTKNVPRELLLAG